MAEDRLSLVRVVTDYRGIPDDAALRVLDLNRSGVAGRQWRYVGLKEPAMWRKCLISIGLSAIVLTACDPQLLIAASDPSDYEVVALVAE